MTTQLCACGCGEPARFAECHFTTRQRSPIILASDYEIRDAGHETPCWIWKGGVGRRYAKVRMFGRNDHVHRQSYRQFVGEIPEGFVIDHLCRVTRCMNPGHLEAVTQAVNQHRGVLPKLTKADVRAIRSSTATARALAEHYGVTTSNIYAIRNGRSWKSV